MTSPAAPHQSLSARNRARTAGFRALSVMALCSAGSVLVLAIGDPSSLGSGLVLLLLGSLSALFITSRLARGERSPSAWWFAAAFSLKQCLTLIILFAGWVPHLDQNDPGYGYDPQRFHFEAWELARSGFDPATIQLLSLNYGGVLYYYGAAFSVFGWSPVVPALLNCITTLAALGFAAWTVQRVRSGPLGLGPAIGGVLLVPDLLWFDVVASRESLLSALVVAVVLLVVLQLRGLVGRGALPLAALGALGIAALRPPILLPVAATLVAAGLLLRRRDASSRRSGRGMAFLVIGGVAAVIGSAALLSSVLGGYDVNLLRDVSAIASASSESSQDFEWASTSIAKRLIPTAPWQVLPFALLRLVLFFVAPWPSPSVTAMGLADGRWTDWQSMLLALSSPLYWIAAPLVGAAAARAWRSRRSDATELTLHLATVAMLLTVAGGNVIVQERYRVMALGLGTVSVLCVRHADFALARRLGAFMFTGAVAASVVWVLLKV